MKDFHVAPVEQPDDEGEGTAEGGAEAAHVVEAPLDRFRRISKQVAAQTANVKWNDIIARATIEANSQIGRCRKRESFKNQQNLLKAMEQAKKLIERAPTASSPNHSAMYDILDPTNQTLVQLLQNISEEINEIGESPTNNLRVEGQPARSVSPLVTLNAQLQSIISRNPSPNPTLKPKPWAPPAKARETMFSPPPAPDMRSLFKARSPTPDSSRSLENPSPVPVIAVSSDDSDGRKSASGSDGRKSANGNGEQKSAAFNDERKSAASFDRQKSAANSEDNNSTTESLKLIDLRRVSNDSACPLQKGPESPVKVIKRKAPVPKPDQDISVSRPAAPKIQTNQGWIAPPPGRDEAKPMQIPTFSTTPATPLPTQKLVAIATEISSETKEDFVTKEREACAKEAPTQASPKMPKEKEESVKTALPEIKDDLSLSTVIAVGSEATNSSTEKLLTISAAMPTPPSPMCLRPAKKVEDVKTIQRQSKAGWL